MKTRTNLIASLAMAALQFSAISPACAQSLYDALRQTTVSGLVGVDEFNYANNSHTPDPTNAFAVGGNLVIHTGAWEGLSAGLGGYTGQSLGLYDSYLAHDDSHELSSTHHSLQSLRESYLQFEDNTLELRGGRQMINTPYATQDFYTFNPRAFMGLAGIVNVLGSGNKSDADSAPLSLTSSTARLALFGARMFTYDGRFTGDFSTRNRYLDHSNGMLTFGARYQQSFGATDVAVQGWVYEFYGLARLYYGQADFNTHLAPDRTLFGAAQMTIEGDPGGAVSSYGHVDGHVFGAKLGMGFGADNVALVGDFSPVSYAAFRHGGIIHPYNDTSGTLFTDTMQMGIEDFGPGYAIGITGNISALSGKLKISPSYVEYKLDYGFGGDVFTYDGAYGFPTGIPIRNEHVHVVDSNFDYNLSKLLQGLSFDWDMDAAMAENGNAGQIYNSPYFSSRLFLKYVF